MNNDHYPFVNLPLHMPTTRLSLISTKKRCAYITTDICIHT